MRREELLSEGRKVLWAGLLENSEEIVSAAPQIFIDAGMLVPSGGAAELERLRLLMNAQPAELTEPQAEALIDAGNRALNDYYHERACSCDLWPQSCHTDPSYAKGYWDTDAFTIGLAAVIGLWEAMRAAETPIPYVLTDPAERITARREESAQKLRALLAGQREDAYRSPLHHDYRTPHDLPEPGVKS